MKPVSCRPAATDYQRSRSRLDRRRSRTRSARCELPEAPAPQSGLFARMTSGASATSSAAYLRMFRRCRRPSDNRSARCGRRSSPVAAELAEMPRGGPVNPEFLGSAREHADARTRSGCCARVESGHAEDDIVIRPNVYVDRGWKRLCYRSIRCSPMSAMGQKRTSTPKFRCPLYPQ